MYNQKYIDFVLDIAARFPEKYELEVRFMAEKQTYVQIVDTETGKVDRITTLKELDQMSVEEKLALSKDKELNIISHRLEPIIRVVMKRTAIATVMEEEAEPPAAEAFTKMCILKRWHK